VDVGLPGDAGFEGAGEVEPEGACPVDPGPDLDVGEAEGGAVAGGELPEVGGEVEGDEEGVVPTG